VFFSNASFSDDDAINQNNGYAPVVQAEKFFVGIDIGEVGFVAELPEQGQGLVAQVAALPGDQDQLHEAEPSAAG
jgi:hypothetical protein